MKRKFLSNAEENKDAEKKTMDSPEAPSRPTVIKEI
jgi:hypothetical protein